MDSVLDPRALGRLKWRCRRGMLENDLLIARFFDRHGATLTRAQASAMELLMALSDNDLLDLLLSRREPEGDLARPDVLALLGLLRTPAAPHP
ncbi:MAG: succinate dehydrogenase assembly factor 2 [Ideonella sp.]|jgi:antitoxin CptB|nr:succinate dehydrogenase assembly factor 2 [Ideonella sp.]